MFTRKFRNTFSALAFAVLATIFLTWALSLVFPGLAWAYLGITLIGFMIVMEIVIYFVPKFSPVFTTPRDTVVVIVGLLFASAIAYIPEWIENTTIWLQVVAHLLAVLSALIVFLTLGSPGLKNQLWKKNKSDTDI